MKGIILAGGQSSRMGSHKALLPYRAERLIDHMAKLLEVIGLAVYVSGQVDGFTCIADVLPSAGPVGGIYSTLQYFGLSTECYLFIPVDMPLLLPQYLQQLVQTSVTTQSCYFADYFLPAVIQDSQPLRDYLQSKFLHHAGEKGSSVQEVLHAVHAHSIAVNQEERRYFSNVNTPQAWQNLLAQE